MHTGHVHRFVPQTPQRDGSSAPQRGLTAGSEQPAVDLFAGVKDALDAQSCDVAVVSGPSSAAWETALTVSLKRGDTVLVVGQCDRSQAWARAALAMGMVVETVSIEGRPIDDLQALSRRLGKDCHDDVKAVFVADTGDARVAAARRVLDENFHDALLMVESTTALHARDLAVDACEVDLAVVTGPGSVLAPKGLTVLAMSPKARPVLHIAAE